MFGFPLIKMIAPLGRSRLEKERHRTAQYQREIEIEHAREVTRVAREKSAALAKARKAKARRV